MDFDSRLFFSALGLAFMLEALPYILFPGRVQEVLRTLAEGDVKKVRRTGLGALAAGMAILFSVLG